MSDVLDVSHEKTKGLKLVSFINDAVADTQRVLIQPYPYVIKMTLNQFNDLVKHINMPDMYNSKERMLMTKHNVMEIEIVEP